MIIFLGVAGSGKSTQAVRLAGFLNCRRIAIGDLLRASMKGEELERMLAGELIEDNRWLPLLEAELKEVGAAEFILDGSPRTLNQAKWLLEKARRYKLRLTAVIHLNASKDIARARLLKRGRADDYDAAINERFIEYETKILPIIDYLKTHHLTIYEIDAEQSEDEVQAQIIKVLGVKPR